MATGGCDVAPHAHATCSVEPALGAEGSIRLGHCAEMDAQVKRETTHRRKGVARLQITVHHEQPKTVNNLPIRWRTGRKIDSQCNWSTHCCMYTNKQQIMQVFFPCRRINYICRVILGVIAIFLILGPN